MVPSRNDGPFRLILSETRRKTGPFSPPGQSFCYNHLKLREESEQTEDDAAV